MLNIMKINNEKIENLKIELVKKKLNNINDFYNNNINLFKEYDVTNIFFLRDLLKNKKNILKYFNLDIITFKELLKDYIKNKYYEFINFSFIRKIKYYYSHIENGREKYDSMETNNFILQDYWIEYNSSKKEYTFLCQMDYIPENICHKFYDINIPDELVLGKKIKLSKDYFDLKSFFNIYDFCIFYNHLSDIEKKIMERKEYKEKLISFKNTFNTDNFIKFILNKGYKKFNWDIILIDWKEQNSFADSNRANNGGGYSQPYRKYLITFGKRQFVLEHSDTSCGDFGERHNYKVKDIHNNLIYSYYSDYVSRTHNQDIFWSGDYPALIQYLIENNYLPRDYKEIEIGAWGSYKYKVTNRKLKNLIKPHLKPQYTSKTKH